MIYKGYEIRAIVTYNLPLDENGEIGELKENESNTIYWIADYDSTTDDEYKYLVDAKKAIDEVTE